jgi:NAD(P)-dependent dehydrogenase (short-subunit alcohol dehydrogenase family)
MDSVLSAANIMQRLSLKDRSCVVTGAGSGIGRALAHAVADAGGAVALIDANEVRTKTIESEIKSRNPRATTLVLVADVTNPQQVSDAMAAAKDTLGGLDVAYNNVGIAQWMDALDMPYEDFQKMFRVNVDSVFLGAVAQARIMKDQKYGKIINTGSISAHIANTPQSQAHYNASKSAVIGLTRSLAVEWVGHGIRVNSISPTYTRTNLVEHFLETEEGQAVYPTWIEMTPMKAMADPTDLQGAAVFLGSAASDFMTGADIVIDGGYLAV